jgi:hypothetical protein
MTNPNKKAPAPAKTQDAFETNTNDLDFPTGQRQRKELITLLEQLALRGHLVIKGPQNDFHVCKYGHSQYCHDFGELHTFAVRLGVIHD